MVGAEVKYCVCVLYASVSVLSLPRSSRRRERRPKQRERTQERSLNPRGAGERPKRRYHILMINEYHSRSVKYPSLFPPPPFCITNQVMLDPVSVLRITHTFPHPLPHTHLISVSLFRPLHICRSGQREKYVTN